WKYSLNAGRVSRTDVGTLESVAARAAQATLMTQAVATSVLDAPESAPALRARPTRAVRWAGIALGLIVHIYAALLLRGFAPAISQPDDNGYFAQGSLLATTGRTWFVPQSDAQYVGAH